MDEGQIAPAAPRTRLCRARCWLSGPAATGPIGGGLIKLGHGSTWAAVIVGGAPYLVCLLIYAAFVIAYLGAVLRFLCTGTRGQRAMERLIAATAAAVVTVLTLAVAEPPRRDRS